MPFINSTTSKTFGTFILCLLSVTQLAQCDVLDQLTKRGQALLVDARMEGIEIRQCTCPEQTECIDEMQMQAIDCVKSCWTTFSAITDQPQKLRTCFVRADVLIDEFVKCFENTVESCLQQREEKMINKVNITEMFRLGIERIEKTKAQLLKSLADGPIKKIMDTTSKFGVCVKDCFLAKNPNQYCFDEKDCQPLLVGAKATKSLRKCTKRIDWKKESGELCECSVKAGIADMEQYCPMLKLMGGRPEEKRRNGARGRPTGQQQKQ
uniref:Uncharacterized protein n=1 Tax=Globodera rostochiensis TaxID=31243 RepID=A0A914GW49_GLORO